MELLAPAPWCWVLVWLCGASCTISANGGERRRPPNRADRKSTRLNSSHPSISYAVFCLKKKKNTRSTITMLLMIVTFFSSGLLFMIDGGVYCWTAVITALAIVCRRVERWRLGLSGHALI